MRVVVGIIAFILGILTVIFSKYIFDNFGRVAWAEDKFGPAGTLTLIRLIGAGLILFGIFFWTGLFEIIFGGIFRTIFGGLNEAIGNRERQQQLFDWLRQWA